MYRVVKPINLKFFQRLTSYRISTRVLSNSMKRNIKESVTLNETEVNIKNLLLEFCNHYNSKIDDESNHLVLRITGGWVRDKLLGDESNDLDIAINHLSGEEFVQKLTEYLTQYHPNLPLRTVHTIKKNPEKSKHLETCTTKIYDRDIDFVNLRSEKYTLDSRIPVIECGTAEEDALRRDATLNALFYNLNESKIEDFTSRGLTDLQNGVLRTPLKPLQTFLDDPLRVLRLIRFASRFNFIVDEETLDAMKTPDIKQSLLHKISRERVGVELEKTLLGRNPPYGLKLLNYANISDSVFNVGTITSNLQDFNDETAIRSYEGLTNDLYKQIELSTNVFPTFSSQLQNSSLFSTFNNVDAKLFWLSVVLIPYRDCHLSISKKKSVSTHVPEIIVKEGLRFGKHDFEPVSCILMNLDKSKDILDRVSSHGVKRSEFGLYLRQFGSFLDANLMVNCFDEICSRATVFKQELSPQDHIYEQNIPIVQEIINKYIAIKQTIVELDLVDIHNIKPIIDGKTISKELNKKPGPWMTKVTQDVLIWQLDNPNGTREECLEYLTHSL